MMDAPAAEQNDLATRQRNSGYRKKISVSALVVSFITLLVFLPALQNDFVYWDDDEFILENRHIRLIDSHLISWSFTNPHTQWTPLRWFSHAIDIQLWGLNPFGHHLTSVLLHMLNVFLVMICSVKILELAWSKKPPHSSEEEASRRRKTIVAAIAAGLLFGIHPLRVESVVWLSERKDVLYGVFFFLSILYYLRYATEVNRQGKKLSYVLSFVFFIMALMSKAMAIMLPFVLLILDIYPLERFHRRQGKNRWGMVIGEKIPFVLCALIVVMLNILRHTTVSLETLPLSIRLLVSFKALSFYILKMIWPSGLAPIHPYPHPSVISLARLEFFLPMLFVISLTFGCFFLWRRQKKAFMIAWLYFLLMLLPVLGLVMSGVWYTAERYTYLACIAPSILAGAGLAVLWERKEKQRLIRVLVTSGTLALVIILSMLTIRQTMIWKDTFSLWDYQLERYPRSHASGIPYANRGKAYMHKEAYQKALDDLNKSLIYDERDEEVYVLRATIYIKQGAIQQAKNDLDRAITLKPDLEKAYSNRCGLYIHSGEYERAIQDCDKAIEIDTRSEMAYNNRGLALFALGRLEESVQAYTEAIALNSDNPGYYFNRGNVYMKAGQTTKALGDFRTASQMGDVKAREVLKKHGF